MAENLEQAHTQYWDSILREEFSKETDRAAVILVVALFDTALDSVLKNFLVECPSSSDDLFDNVNAPLSNFSAKINMAFRLGVISTRFCRDLHIVRKIRNDFAHDIHNCNFENSKVKSRIMDLTRSSGIMEEEPEIRKSFPEGTRGDFLMVCSWMLWSLNTTIEYMSPLEASELEFGYLYRLESKEEDTEQENK